MTFIRNTHLLIALLFIITAAATAPASADNYLEPMVDRNPMVRPENLQGVDTIIVENNFGPDAAKLLGINSSISPWFVSAVKDTFSSQPWVAIKPYTDNHHFAPELDSPNAILLSVYLSAHEDVINGKPVKVASLGIELSQSAYYKKRLKFSPPPISYPFIAPDDPEQLGQKIAEGVHFLIGFLPDEFCGKNPNGARCTAPRSAYPTTSGGPTK